MLQAVEGILGPDSDTAADVSQLKAFPGVPFQVFVTNGGDIQSRLHKPLSEDAQEHSHTYCWIKPRSLVTSPFIQMFIEHLLCAK